MPDAYAIEAGKLRHRLAIQSHTEARDSFGGSTKTWATQKTVWGSVRPMSGKELVNAQQVDSRVTHRIVIRFYSGLDTTYRFLFGTRVFNIVSVLNIQERNKLLVITAIEEGLTG